MDVEVIWHEGELTVIEIDARLPSQTPTTVYWSTGLNMVEMLGDVFLNGRARIQPDSSRKKGVIYEHVSVTPDQLEFGGEHIMSGIDALKVCPDFFGADEAITNYEAGRDDWVATLIVVAENIEAAWEKRNSVIADIKKRFNLK